MQMLSREEMRAHHTKVDSGQLMIGILWLNGLNMICC